MRLPQVGPYANGDNQQYESEINQYRFDNNMAAARLFQCKGMVGGEQNQTVSYRLRSEWHQRIDDTERARPLDWLHCVRAWRYPGVTTTRRPQLAAITPSVLVELHFPLLPLLLELCRTQTTVPSPNPYQSSAFVKKITNSPANRRTLADYTLRTLQHYNSRLRALPLLKDEHNVGRTTQGTADQRHQRQQWRRTESARRTGQGR